MAEIIQSLLHYKGFLYYKHSGKINSRTYWRCKRMDECGARIVSHGNSENLMIIKGGNDEDHTHAPNIEEVEALKIVISVKRKAADHPEAPPTQILRSELRNVSSGVLAELPDRLTLRKTISRTRLKNLPPNPQIIDDLEEIPTDFRSALSGENFLLYDSYEDEDYENEFGRIIVLATKENLRNLFRSVIWFVDGTFSCAPSIFFQVFAILAAVNQPPSRGEIQTIGLPFVYALLETKQEGAYKKVLQITI